MVDLCFEIVSHLTPPGDRSDQLFEALDLDVVLVHRDVPSLVFEGVAHQRVELHLVQHLRGGLVEDLTVRQAGRVGRNREGRNGVEGPRRVLHGLHVLDVREEKIPLQEIVGRGPVHDPKAHFRNGQHEGSLANPAR